MVPGTPQQALQLAVQRWAQLWPFDLPAETCEQLFSLYPAGTILEAIKCTRLTHDQRPEQIYRSLLYFLDKLQARYN